jgi:acyl dehydratase
MAGRCVVEFRVYPRSVAMSSRSFDDFAGRVNQEIAVSEWLLVTQERVTEFARVTDDPDWMHIDVERARRGPVGHTIAQGFLTLSLLLHFSRQGNYLPKDVDYAFNYGLNRVRWLAPVAVGARIRNRTVLKAVTRRGASNYLVTTLNTVEIDGSERPAMIAEWLGLVHSAGQDSAVS